MDDFALKTWLLILYKSNEFFLFFFFSSNLGELFEKSDMSGFFRVCEVLVNLDTVVFERKKQ